MAISPESRLGNGTSSEGSRREVAAALRAVEAGADADLDRLVRLAARIFNSPIAFIGVVDRGSVRYLARFGIDAEGGPADGSMCAETVATPDLTHLVVGDALKDARFCDGELVIGPVQARFFVGTPIVMRGQKFASLCVGDRLPRQDATAAQLAELADLAALAGSLFELKDEARVRARMAAELIKEEWRHALTLEAGKVGSWVWDLRTGEIVANEIFGQMFDISGPSLNADELFSRIDPADVAAVNQALRATFDQGVDYEVEFRVAATGRWLTGRGRVYQRDGAGKPLILMGVNIDVTEARQSAEQTRLLLRELNHRVKNTLAMI